MNRNQDPVEDLLDVSFPAYEPSPDQLASVRAASNRFITQHLKRSRNRRNLLTSLAVVIVASSLLLGQIAGPPVASAQLAAVADSVRSIDPFQVPAQGFTYISANTLVTAIRWDPLGQPIVLQAEATSEVWRGTDEYIQIRTTTGEPSFFDSDSARRFRDHGVAGIPGTGETVTQTLSGINSFYEAFGWSGDPEQLETTIRSERTDGSDEQVFSELVSLLSEPATPQDLRAAAIELLSKLDIEIAASSDGSLTLTMTTSWASLAAAHERVILLPSGHISLYEVTLPDGDTDLGIPPGTVVQRTRYELPVVVDSLDKH